MSARKFSYSRRLASERRRAELLGRYVLEALANDPTLTQAGAEAIAKSRMPPEGAGNPHYESAFLETAPSSLTVPRKKTNSAVEINAMFRDPGMSWLFRYLQQERRGRPGSRSLTAATLFQMANFGRPDVINTRRNFTGSGPFDWAYGNPKGPSADSAFYESIKQMTRRHRSGATIHVNLDLLDRIASLKDPSSGKLLHPDAFKRCVVDGTQIDADVPQTPVGGPSPGARKERVRVLAGAREMADFAVHGYEPGSEPGDGSKVKNVRKSVFGYTLVVIACMDLGLPIIWTLTPASGNERDALMRLLKCLYELRPEFPMEYLVGDGLYTTPHDLMGHLYFKYGIHGCFPRREKATPGNPWAKTGGVPTCKHGMMQFEKEGEIWGPAKRKVHGLRPGAYPKETRPRLRWKCPRGTCEGTSTFLPDDWHLNTYLHQQGSHRRAASRAALLSRRNIIESIFAQLKHAGPGSRWPGRARWADDDGMRWLTSLALLTMTAKRLAHESGAYLRAFQEARRLGHLSEREMEKGALPHHGVLEGEEVPPGRRMESKTPSSWDPEYMTPIDEKYVLRDLGLYSDEPDRPWFARDVPPV